MEPRTDWVPAPPRDQDLRPLDQDPARPHPGFELPPLGPPPQDPQQRSWLRRRLGPILAALVALGAKLKALLLLLPKIKLFSTAGTMLVSLAAYALLWGWQFAAGFIALLFVHE